MMRPMPEFVLLELVKEEKKKSAILLPEDSEKHESGQGKVVAVGSDVKNIKKGDVVFYKKYSENKIKDGDKEYMAVKAVDILATK